MIYDVIIIGAGPAGMSAGIYLCRQKLSALILSKDIGGQAAKSWQVENYLGYQMLAGGELVQKFKEHLDSFKCVIFKNGVEIEKITAAKSRNLFQVLAGKNKKYESRAVIVASGKTPKMLNVPGEKKYLNKGITYCATCDAPLFSDKNVAVIGGGDAAFDAAFQLTKIAKKIYILVRSDKLKPDLDKVLAERVIKSGKVKIIYNAEISKVFGEKFLSGLEYKDNKAGKSVKLGIEGIFVEIGSVPAVAFCRGLVKLNAQDEIIVDKNNMSSVPGIFAAGDATDVVEKQVIIAAGEGAKAAIAAANYLSRVK